MLERGALGCLIAVPHVFCFATGTYGHCTPMHLFTGDPFQCLPKYLQRKCRRAGGAFWHANLKHVSLTRHVHFGTKREIELYCLHRKAG